MEQITITTPSGSYAVVCARGAIARAGALVSALRESTHSFVISSPKVWKHWGVRLEASFGSHGGARVILFDDREATKMLRTVEKLCRTLVRAGADRECTIVAVGGGVVGDVAGFVAASYLRGVALVQVPTTLVAQVDSAIGGKTGVNLPEGKNLVGAFHQPRLVIADPEVLRSLPRREYVSGVYEVIKYGVIGDPELFEFLESKLDAVVRKESEVLDWVLPRCMEAKARVVSTDERESGLRAILNFGHTFAHALESSTRYRRFLHGEAVGWGMIAASRLAAGMDLLEEKEAQRIVQLILRVGPLPALPQVQPQRLLDWMRADKKTRAGRMRFVLPQRIGHVEVLDDVAETLVKKTLSALREVKPGKRGE